MIVFAVLDGENHVKLVCEKEEAAYNTAKRYGRGWHVRMFDTEYGDSFEDNALYVAELNKEMTKVRAVLCECPERYGLLKGTGRSAVYIPVRRWMQGHSDGA